METNAVYVVVEMMGAARRDVGSFDAREEAMACLKARGLEHLTRAQREQHTFGGDARKQEQYAAALLEKGLAGDLLDVGTAQFAVEERQKRAAVPEPKPISLLARTEPQDETIYLLVWPALVAAKDGHKPLPMRCIGLHQLCDFLTRCANDLHFSKRSDLDGAVVSGEKNDSDETVCYAQGDQFLLTVLYPGKIVPDEGDFTIFAALDRESRHIVVIQRGRYRHVSWEYRGGDPFDQIISMLRDSYYRGLRPAN